MADGVEPEALVDRSTSVVGVMAATTFRVVLRTSTRSQQMLGFCLPIWAMIVPPTDEVVWQQNIAVVARELAGGGTAIATQGRTSTILRRRRSLPARTGDRHCLPQVAVVPAC